MISNHHAKYYAYDLCRTGGEGVDRLGRALFDAAVDLNPHQINVNGDPPRECELNLALNRKERTITLSTKVPDDEREPDQY